MREPELWESFFDPELTLTQLQLTPECENVVDFGCGYGAFALAAASMVRGTVFALDVDSDAIAIAKRRAAAARIRNVSFVVRDVFARGTGLPDGSMDYAMLFDILHCKDPRRLLREAHRNLKSGGTLGLMHWGLDPDTPRGPPVHVRPRPEQCKLWAEEAGFVQIGDSVEVPPFHYGLALRR